MNKREIDKIISSGNNVYIVGIKGAGVAGLAQILQSNGFNVRGSDTHEKFFTDRILKENHIPYKEGFSKSNLPKKIDWVLASNAYLGEPIKGQKPNPEIKELRRRKIPILSYPEVLSYFFNQSFGIAIAGTHGKTSVTAMVAFILHEAGLKPNALVGGEVLNWGSNAAVGNSNIFILEADEYKDAFLNYKPDIAVILNMDWDHPDYFKTYVQYKKSFKKFTANIKPGGKVLTLKDFNKAPKNIDSPLIGEFNQFNLRAAYAVARYLGVPGKTIRAALKVFKGTKRRLEVVGRLPSASLRTSESNIVIDDYAHNAQKVASALTALKKHYPRKKVVVVFQPHTFSRTEQFLKDFAEALIIADEIHLLDIYSSAREAKGKITSDNIVLEIKRRGCDALNLKTIKNAEKYFRVNPPKNAIIAAMGAGDVGKLAYILAGKKELV